MTYQLTDADIRGIELDRRIAEKLGYVIEVYPKGKGYHVGVLFDGEVMMQSDHMDTEERAYLAASYHLPTNSLSVDEAKTLPIDDDMAWDIFLSQGKNLVSLLRLAPPDGTEIGRWYGKHDLPLAASMCVAWLAWKEREGE